MHDQVQKLREAVQVLERRLLRVRAVHVNTRKVKDLFRSLARIYFGEWRPSLVAHLGSDEELSQVDFGIQEFVRLAQVRSRVSDYRTNLSSLKRVIGDLELTTLQPRASVALPPVPSHHKRILESLLKISVAAASSFEQGLLDLQSGGRKSWRGTTVEFREALRETLDTLAPDDAVTGQPGFKLEPDAKGPTMKQKAVFILRSRRLKDPQLKSFTDAINVIEELIGKLVRSVYTRSSLAVHVADSKDEARKVRDYVTLVLGELLEVRE